MICQYTGYCDDPEAPEPTDAEIEADYLDAIEQKAPAIDWAAFWAMEENRKNNENGGRMSAACECDYSLEDDRYVKTSRRCPVHDMCQWCDTGSGSVAVGRDWVCSECVLLEGQESAAVAIASAAPELITEALLDPDGRIENGGTY